MLKKVNTSYKYYFADIKKRQNFGKLTSKEFSSFLKKFYGILIYRGKKSYSIRTFNYLLYNLKKQFKKDPIKLLNTIAKKLMPIFVIGKKRYRNSIVDVPVLAYGNKKIFYILNWLVRQLRNKGNVVGIKKQDILRILVDSLQLRSKNVATDAKKQHEEILQNVKHNLRRNSYHKKILKAWRNKVSYFDREQKDEASLNLTERQKFFYREGKILFNFFKMAYLNVFKKRKFNRYEKIVYKKYLLNKKYSTFIKGLAKRWKAKKNRKFFKFKYKYGKRSKKRI